MNTTTDFLEAIPAALAAAFEGWQPHSSSELRDFLLDLVPAVDADTILEMVKSVGEAEATLLQSALPARVWLGESLKSIVPEILADGPLGDLRGMEPVELGSRIIDLGLVGITGFGGAAVEAIAKDIAYIAENEGLASATRYFQSPLGDPIEREVVAVASATILMLGDSLKMERPGDVATLTGVVNIGLRIAKIAYKQAAGELDSDARFHALENTIAAVAVGLADQLVNRFPEIGAGLGVAIGALLQNPALGEVVGRSVGALAAPLVRPLVRKGVDTMARKAVHWVSAASRTTYNKLKSLVL